jgi:NAD(P)-dependent dehydrogenase (short-subunit alcohol dehydrogenase family)
VVGAAGVLGALTPVSHLEPKGWDMILSTNLTANWRLIRSPWTRCCAALGRRPGHVLLTSSVAKTRPGLLGRLRRH